MCKENFCAPCLAPLLIAAGSAAGLASGESETKEAQNKKNKINWILYWVSLAIMIVTVMIQVYFLFIKKGECKSCRVN